MALARCWAKGRVPFMAVMSLVVGAVFWLRRRALAENLVNRRFMTAALVMMGSFLASAAVSLALGMAIADALVIEMLNAVLMLACMAVFIEARLTWAALAYAVWVPVAVARPSSVLLCEGLATAAAFATLALLSRRAA